MESEVVYSPGEMTAEDHKISEVQLPSFEKLEDSSESEQILPHKKFATCPVIKIDTKKSHWYALLDTVAQLSAVSEKTVKELEQRERKLKELSTPTRP